MLPVFFNKLMRLRNRHFFICDLIIFCLTPLLALGLRFDGELDLSKYMLDLAGITVLFLGIKQSILYLSGFYRRCWRYASVDELQQIGILMLIAILLESLLVYVMHLMATAYRIGFPIENIPRSLPPLDGMLSFLLIGGLRFSIRVADRLRWRYQRLYSFPRRERVLIVGAGSAGVALIQEIQQNPKLGLRPIALIDDDPTKFRLRIRGLSVVGDRYAIPRIVQSLRIRKVIIAMPMASGRVIRDVLEICRKTGVATSILPGIHEMLKGQAFAAQVRDVEIEDLLRREPVQMDGQQVSQFLKGKRILITGAGGSIGSELCRQILKCQPSEMILLGHGENSVFTIQQELQQTIPILQAEGKLQKRPSLTAYIADIRLIHRLEHLFEQFQPQMIFHAAAHKHVPMMELNAPEAITNNVQGTKNLVDLALKYGVEHLVMVSTDKVVNPTNVMGASKRMAEMIVLRAAQKHQKPFVVVRFGNVLGSRGSVVPTFKRQITEGGPVTVTHPEICRYFMTIPEAVQLVLQAAVVGRGGEVCMLDMGQPVKIVDLAKELIRLSGYELGQEIDIVFTGLRPGEKLYEELFLPDEEYEQTEHQKLFIVKNASRGIPDTFDTAIEALCRAAIENNDGLIRGLLQQWVVGYQPERTEVGAEVGAETGAETGGSRSLAIGLKPKEVITGVVAQSPV